MLFSPIWFEEHFLIHEKWPSLNGAIKNSSNFLHFSLTLSYATNTHFYEPPKAVGR